MAEYNIEKLVYYEVFDMFIDAVPREKYILGYLRIKKKRLIEGFNKNWDSIF
jgi:putative endonuclease